MQPSLLSLHETFRLAAGVRREESNVETKTISKYNTRCTSRHSRSFSQDTKLALQVPLMMVLEK